MISVTGACSSFAGSQPSRGLGATKCSFILQCTFAKFVAVPTDEQEGEKAGERWQRDPSGHVTDQAAGAWVQPPAIVARQASPSSQNAVSERTSLLKIVVDISERPHLTMRVSAMKPQQTPNPGRSTENWPSSRSDLLTNANTSLMLASQTTNQQRQRQRQQQKTTKDN
jgi:hypothetical protein